MRTMKSTTSVSFTKDGVLNPEAIEYFVTKQLDTLVVFSDGSEAAFEHIRTHGFDQKFDVTKLAIARPPVWDLRLVNSDGTRSKPNYVYSDQNRVDWFCNHICAPLTNIVVSNVGENNQTKVTLSRQQVEMICDMALNFWQILSAAEDRLRIPAIVLDSLTLQSRLLNAESMNITTLREATGLQSLDYNSETNMLSIEIAGEISTVKLTVLDAFFAEYILPFFNRYQGRRWQLEVSILGITDQENPQAMTYGELGRIVTEMYNLIEQQKITADTPMSAEDLLSYSKKVKINEESCLFGTHGRTFTDLLQEARSFLVIDKPDPAATDSATLEDAEPATDRMVCPV